MNIKEIILNLRKLKNIKKLENSYSTIAIRLNLKISPVFGVFYGNAQ